MSQQEFYETVQLAEEYQMKKWLEHYIDETADQLVCRHCYTLKGEAQSCCDDKDWMFFKDLPLVEQMDQANREWQTYHGGNK